jgi:nucleotide-binding universal stress UspA family protein
MNTKPDQRPIVCGTDFSACAIEAADIAAAIARKLSAKLVLVHVDDFHGFGIIDPLLLEASRSRRSAELERHADRLRKSKTIVEGRVVSGSPFDQIVNAAVRGKARLVVVGAVGHGLAKRLLLGSVAERVAETSPIPTLIVRPRSKLLSWVKGNRRLKILVGYDFSATADAALRWIAQLSRIGKFSVIAAHVHAPNESHHSERELLDRAAKILPPHDTTVRLVSSWGNCQGALFYEAAREHADLIVIGTHQRRGIERVRLGSVSRGVLRHVTQNVAVVPPASKRSLRH